MPEISRFNSVVDVRYVGRYRVWLKFSDGLSGEIDLEDQLWGPVFEPLKILEALAAVRVDSDTETIVWPNGADLSPAWLHERLNATIKTAAAE